MKFHYTIDGKLPGLNEILKAAKSNFYIYSKMKKQETTRCAYAAIKAGLPAFKNPIHLSIRWIEPNNRRDPDNIRAGVKFIADSLVLLKKLPNDNKKWMRSINDEFAPADPRKPRIEIEITES